MALAGQLRRTVARPFSATTVPVRDAEEQKFLIGGTGTSLALLARLPSAPQVPPPLVAGTVSLESTNREAVQ